MLTGIKDLDLKIFSELNDEDLFSMCLTSKVASKLCDDDNLWRGRFIEKYGEYPKNKERTWKDFYIKVVYYKNFIGKRIPQIIKDGGSKNIDLLNFFIEQGEIYGLYPATLYGDMDVINFVIEKGSNDWDMGLMAAAERGDVKLADFFIKKGAKDLETALVHAYVGNNFDMINFLLKEGAGDELGYIASQRFRRAK